MNANIPKDSYLGEDFSLDYPSVDMFSDLLIQKQGVEGNCMLKCDLSLAYRKLRTYTGNYIWLEFK